MIDKKILDDVWKQHRENKDSKHESRAHFCRACLDMYAKLYEGKVKKAINRWISIDYDKPQKVQVLKALKTELWLEK